jgi:outer membrane protein OmpA-like peptidoglycan-associated protein
MKHIIRSTTGALAVAMLAAGCSTAPKASDVAAADTAIGNAGHAVDQAAADPHVAQYAPSELERASASLEQAKTAWSKQHDLQTATHLAYIAQQRAATAQQLANERASEEVVRVAAVERDHAVQMAAAARSAAPGTEVAQEGLAGFAPGAAKLPPNAARAINDLATTLKDNPDSKVVIEGHTDSVGGHKYNQTLAMKRAEAVRAALLRYKIDPSRILLGAQGEANPVASNDTPAGRRENRRVDVTIAGAGAGAEAVAGGAQMGSSQGSTATTSSGAGGQNGQNGQDGHKGQ